MVYIKYFSALKVDSRACSDVCLGQVPTRADNCGYIAVDFGSGDRAIYSRKPLKSVGRHPIDILFDTRKWGFPAIGMMKRRDCWPTIQSPGGGGIFFK